LKRRDHSEDLAIDSRMDLKEIEWNGVDRTYLAQDRDQLTIMEAHRRENFIS
jgi:hypothetical protein